MGSRCEGLARETRKTIEWETDKVARSAAAIEEWRRTHPVQALAIRTGLKTSPAELQRLEQTHAESIRFLQGSRRRLEELEQAWPKKRLACEQKFQREGIEIRTAKTFLGVIDAHSEHFQKFWQRQDNAFQRDRLHKRHRSRDRGRGR